MRYASLLLGESNDRFLKVLSFYEKIGGSLAFVSGRTQFDGS